MDLLRAARRPSWPACGPREGVAGQSNRDQILLGSRDRFDSARLRLELRREIVESLDVKVGVVLSSTLATLPLLEERGAALLVRMCGRTLTTVIVHTGNLCVYRSTEMSAEAGLLDPQAMLDEIFPAIAYYQDAWGGMIDRVRMSGLGTREELFRRALTGELKVAVGLLADSEQASTLDSTARDLLQLNLDALVGWSANGGS